MTRFGVIQDYIGRDGRSKTLTFLVELLNRRGIVPTILTFSGPADAADFRSIARSELELDLVTLPPTRIHLGHVYNQLRLPFLVRDRLEAFDIVFACDTGVYGYPGPLELIRFVCFPIEQVPRYEERYRRLPYRVWGMGLGLVQRRLRRRSSFHGTWIAISEFTREAMLETYPLSRDQIAVLYPPASTDHVVPSMARERAVVSLARFNEDKHQLEQIELARSFPDIPFYLAGSTRFSGYYERCREAAAALENVELLPNIDSHRVETLLQRAKVFLHTKRYEHFGMSTVEAVTRGCIPVVHDSGGQREVVPFPELRFATLEEASKLLARALDGQFDHLLPELQAHVRRFGADEFCRQLDSLLDGVLGRPGSATS